MIGFFISVGVKGIADIDLPWWLYAGACALLVHWLCVRGIEFSGKVLLSLLALELGAVLLADLLAIVWKGTSQAYDFSSFQPSNVFTPGFGPSLVFVVASYMGSKPLPSIPKRLEIRSVPSRSP